MHQPGQVWQEQPFEIHPWSHCRDQRYKLSKKQMGWKTTATPVAFQSKGRLIRNPTEMANIQLDHSHNKVDKLMNALPNIPHNPLHTLREAFKRWSCKARNIPLLKIQPVGIEKTLKHLIFFGNGVSFGYDGIDRFSLKVAADILAKPINHITNLSIKQNKFTSKWQIGRLIPLLKGKGMDKLSPSSFCPIALLPAIAKIVEKSIQEQIMSHMKDYNLWNRNLHSYRNHHSTNTALGQIVDFIHEDSEDKNISNIMAIDKSAAFDCLQFFILLDKLQFYKFHPDTIKWFHSYLTSRSQFVSIGGHKSRTRKVDMGVPQGSILGPVLYNLYINELPDVMNDHDLCKDDAHKPGEDLFNRDCRRCGNLTCYTDDAYYSVGSKSHVAILESRKTLRDTRETKNFPEHKQNDNKQPW